MNETQANVLAGGRLAVDGDYDVPSLARDVTLAYKK